MVMSLKASLLAGAVNGVTAEGGRNVASGARSIRNPVSLLVLSVQIRSTCPAEIGVAIRPPGGASGAATTIMMASDAASPAALVATTR